jgi:DMSO/TMAO reductase YedYZ molybdopterin-dependent catalytic subunit
VGADRGDDGFETAPFARTLPIEKALDPDTLLAYRMNSAPLPPEHGYPLRAVVPGWYAMDSVKWLVGIDALDHSDTGPFMTRDYVARRLEAVGSKSYQLTSLRVKSQIARPRDGETITQKSYSIRGAAWAAGALAKVEVSTDGGATWNTPRLEGEPLAYTWSLWNYQWNIETPGRYTLMARARDAAGDEQPRGRDPNRLDTYERNSYHAVECTVL